MARIHPLIGMGSDQLLTELGEEREGLSDIHAKALQAVQEGPAPFSAVVGDTRWDIEAAAKIGLEVVCVLTGGWTRRDLTDAGAVAAYSDVAELDDSPLARLLK